MSGLASRITALLAVATITLGAADAGALCAMPPPRPRALLGSIDHLPRGGAVVVDLGDSPITTPPRLVGVDGTARVLRVETAAPGLALVFVPADAPIGRATLEGVLDEGLVVDVTAEALPPPPSTPVVRALTRTDVVGPRRHTSTFDAELRGSPPVGAVALIATWGTAATWAVTGDGTHLRLGYTGRCDGRGSQASIGDRVTLVWMDRHGQRSGPSAPVTVHG